MGSCPCRLRAAASAVLLSLSIAPVLAIAAPVTYEFTAQVTRTENTVADVGTTITGYLTADGPPVQAPAYYVYTVLGSAVTFQNGANWSYSGTNGGRVNLVSRDGSYDTFEAYANVLNNDIMNQFRLRLVDQDMTAWSTSDLPTTIVLEQFETKSILMAIHSSEPDSVCAIPDIPNCHVEATITAMTAKPTSAQQVRLDIKPGQQVNEINPVNPGSNGVLAVSILSGSGFDATQVYDPSVRFGRAGTEAAAESHSYMDTNSDGQLDLVLHFRTEQTGIQCGDTTAQLTGQTAAGGQIAGSDVIRTVGCN